MDYFDLHCDTLNRIVDENLDFFSVSLFAGGLSNVHFDKRYQCFAVWTDDKRQDKSEYIKNCIGEFRKIKEYNLSSFKPILTVENCGFLSDDYSLLEVLLQNDVFCASLTWNGQNAFASGAYSSGGITAKGRELIKKFNENNIVCDLAHLNYESFNSALEIADNVIVSHTCISEIFPSKRNITLQMANRVKDKNGLIGICFYPEFLGNKNVFEGVYENIYFLLQNGFENNIALGSDFDGADIPIKSADLPKLYEYLIGKGIKKSVTEKIFFKNAYNYYKNFDK
ncbi:MAG: dipeptidase [Clostridia bacterium]|nr:dipeptidase [Clostridia bacterium]